MSFVRRLANLFRRDRLDSEIDEELQSHIELAAEAGERSGLSPGEAHRLAQLQFGNALSVRERTADADVPVVLEHLWRDTRHSFRQLRRSPVLSATAIATLALGIGATTAVYTLIEQVMLRPLPVANADRLWRVGHGAQCCYKTGYAQDDWVFFPFDAYTQFRSNTPTFEEITAFQVGKADLVMRRVSGVTAGRAGSGDRRAVEARTGQYVSGSFFRTFGVGPARGRLFTEADDARGAPPAAVLSYHTWESQYASDPTIVGSTYEINGTLFTIIGVAAAGFYGAKLARTGMPDVWLPLVTEPLVAGRTSRLDKPDIAWLDIIGRVSPEADTDALELQLNAELKQWLAGHAAMMTSHEKESLVRQKLRVTPAANGISLLGDEYEGALTLLLIAATCVLLIACANVANLLVARGLKDAHQTALRTALGASRSRLVRKALIESLALSVCGAVAGVAVAYAGAAVILRLVFPAADAWTPISAAPSLPVLAAALAISLVTAMASGIAPAWLTTRADPMDAMRGTTRSVRAGRSTPQQILVVVQVALSFVLISAATMLGRSVRNLERDRLGFDSRGRYVVSMNSLLSGYTPEQMNMTLQQIEMRLRAIPGVRSVAAALYAPMYGLYWSHDVRVDGPDRGGDEAVSSWTRVTPAFFETVGSNIVAGRGINATDNSTAPRVAVVNESFAKHFFAARSVIGRHFSPASSQEPALYEIVGVVSDMRYFTGAHTSEPMYFVPQAQSTDFGDDKLQGREVWSHYPYNLIVWAPSVSRTLEPDIRKVIGDVAPAIVVHGVQPYDELIHGAYSQENMIATLSRLFGAISLVLASVGLYGVIAYGVEQRTGEIGVRMALGAQRAAVVGMVVRGALSEIASGIALGVPAAVVAGSLLASSLFGVRPHDPFVLALAAALLLSAGCIAALVPARRAAAVNPLQTLRT